MRNNYHDVITQQWLCVITNKNYQNPGLGPGVKFLEDVVALELRELRFLYGDVWQNVAVFMSSKLKRD